jgi:hypothetical protein
VSHFNEFQLLALQLINLVERRRDEMLQSTAQRHMSPQTFAREYATLHLNAGRCVGKSELIRQIMRADDIVIVPNESLRDVLFATKASQTLAASQLDTGGAPRPSGCSSTSQARSTPRSA